MTNLSKEQRRFLGDNYSIHSLELVQKVEGGDSTKFLFKTTDGHLFGDGANIRAGPSYPVRIFPSGLCGGMHLLCHYPGWAC